MKLGYNTNGMAHHRLADAIDLLAEEGYQSLAITLEAGALDPYWKTKKLFRETDKIRRQIDELGLACVIETGARYLLNPKKKHDPTLLDPEPERREIRIDFLKRSIAVSAMLGSPLISFWSGKLPDPASPDEAFDRLETSIRSLLEMAEEYEMILAFEPEPGMFIDTFEQFRKLDERVDHELFQLTVDIGHVHCIEDGPISEHLKTWGPRIRNIHIEDMKRGIHDHLMFGEGTINFADVVSGLKAIQYTGGLHVELSRHSHMAVEAVRQSAKFLKPKLA